MRPLNNKYPTFNKRKIFSTLKIMKFLYWLANKLPKTMLVRGMLISGTLLLIGILEFVGYK